MIHPDKIKKGMTVRVTTADIVTWEDPANIEIVHPIMKKMQGKPYKVIDVSDRKFCNGHIKSVRLDMGNTSLWFSNEWLDEIEMLPEDLFEI